MIYSPSRLETYRQCPQKFKFGYIDGIKSPIEGIEAFMGSRVHEALEKLYTHLRFCKPMTLNELLTHYHEQWEKEWHEAIQIVREGMTPDEYEAMGAQCLSTYYQRYAPFNQSLTLGLEYPVKFSLDPENRYVMQGFIDRLSSPEEGVIWIHDYKTKGFFPTQPEIDEDRQLAYYQIAIQALWPKTRTVVLIWHYLLFNQELQSKRTHEELEALRQETLNLIQEIETAVEFPTRKSGLCNWCEYQTICPLFRHRYEVDALDQTTYTADEGIQWAERLVVLQLQEEKTDDEIKKTKEALASYAVKKGIETVFTKTHQVLIRFYDNIRFPKRDEPGRAHLEKLIKSKGKWEEASSLDTFALSKILKSGVWEPEVVAEVKRLGTPEKTSWIKVSPRKRREAR